MIEVEKEDREVPANKNEKIKILGSEKMMKLLVAKNAVEVVAVVLHLKLQLKSQQKLINQKEENYNLKMNSHHPVFNHHLQTLSLNHPPKKLWLKRRQINQMIRYKVVQVNQNLKMLKLMPRKEKEYILKVRDKLTT